VAPLVASEPYVVASFRINSAWELQEVPPAELARVILKVVEIEGPIHGDEIARRVTQLFGFQRTGSRISQAVQQALAFAARQQHVLCEGSFFVTASRSPIRVRDRGEVTSPTLRKPEMLPPAEIRQAVEAIVTVHLGIERSEVIAETVRLFGFKSTSANLRDTVGAQIEQLLSGDQLVQQNGKLYAREREDESSRAFGTAN